MELKNTDTTRYLCAAVQLDENFCNQIIKEIVEEEHRAIGISYGVDLPTVVKHCLAARERRDSRDFKLALIFLLAIVPVILNPISFTIFYTLAYIIVFSELRFSRYKVVAKHLLKKNYCPDIVKIKFSPELEGRIQEIANEQNGNVIAYGDFSPFVGAGFNIGGWSFALNVQKGKKEVGTVLEPLSFQTSEIYDEISKSIIKLNINGLAIEDNLYVNGQDIRDDIRFIPNPLASPVTQIKPSLIGHFAENPTSAIRHYKCIRVTDWNGEIILSIFLRFSKIGNNLFTEASYFLLTPLRDYYRQFDTIKPGLKSKEQFTTALQSILKTIFLWAFSPVAAWFRITRITRQKKQRKENRRIILEDSTFNYGAVSSLRERISKREYRRYFQKLDQEMYLKIFEIQIIDTIKKFLESKNIDISDLEETRTTILNHGVIVSGGSIEAQNLTVGEQAKSVITNSAKSATPRLHQDSDNL